MSRWLRRERPLPPGGAFAHGTVKTALIDRLLRESDHALAGIVGVAGPEGIALLGEVPWVDGVTWLGQDPQAPGLWMPTREMPELPIALVASALSKQAPLPLAWVAPDLVLPLGAARPLTRARLEAARLAGTAAPGGVR